VSFAATISMKSAPRAWLARKRLGKPGSAYESGDVVEVGCWAHCRRYFYKALTSDPTRAEHALSMIRGLYRLERPLLTATRKKRGEVRRQKSRPIADAFFDWCEQQAALDETPISATAQPRSAPDEHPKTHRRQWSRRTGRTSRARASRAH